MPVRFSKRVEGAKPIELVRLYASANGSARSRGGFDARLHFRTRRQGYEPWWLGVWERNSRASAFYANGRFMKLGNISSSLGEDRQTDVLMERSV